MTDNNNIKQSSQWARQAMDRIEYDSVEPTPNNYTVYYHYFMGDMPALVSAYNGFATLGRVTQSQCDELYNKHFTEDAEAVFLKDASSIIDNELKKVVSLLDSSVKGTDKFGANLTQFSGKLTTNVSIETLREAVAHIIEETRVVAAQNHRLQEELTSTTGQLAEMRTDFDRIHKESQIDPLTEVGNRKYFDREMASALSHAQNEGEILSLLMIDIDHFKKFNDTHGHLIGDQVLRLVARTLVENLKGRDVIARYGGEEFVIILPQTKVQDAERVANQLRASLATKHIRRRGSNEVLGVITISLGAAEYVDGEDKDSFIGRADAALYRAKQTGRNKVICA